MLFSRAWFALMRRNVVYRKRNWLGSLMEILLPMGFVGALVGIKRAVERTKSLTGDIIPAMYPNDTITFTPLSFQDYIVALQAKRQCVFDNQTDPFEDEIYKIMVALGLQPPIKNNTYYSITGIAPRGFNWQVPLVKCNSYQCTKDKQDATSFCEYSGIALVGMNPGGIQRAYDFKEWLYSTYPILNHTNHNNSKTKNHQISWSKIVPDFGRIFNSSQELDHYITNSKYGQKGYPKIAMGIVFDGNDTNSYRYTLRQNSTNYNSPENANRPSSMTTPNTKRSFNSFARNDFEVCIPQDSSPRQGPLELSCTGQYVYNGILTFQRLLGDYIMNRTGSTEKGYYVSQAGVAYVQFPTRPYQTTGFYASIKETGPLMIALGVLYPVASMISYISREKELKQKELMKMMSVSESDIGWSWFLSFFLFNIITASITSAMSKLLYTNSDGFLLWFFWFISFLTFTVFSLTAASLSSKSARAVLIGLLVFFVGVFLTIALNYEKTEGIFLSLICIHPLAAFSYALQEIGRLEDDGVGLQRNVISTTDNPSGYAFADFQRSLLIDCLLWGIASWYLNRVIKPDYGQALPLWFPFQLSYWFPSRAVVNSPVINDQPDIGDNNEKKLDVPVEPVSEQLKRQAVEGTNIEIRGLQRMFGTKAAVDNLTLSMYKGQITALLGHNGAGKTTTINMLTGALEPSSGWATVAGKDIRTQMPLIRQDVGICLQHDCLFPQLTVREHVQFFSRLKGLYSRLSLAEADEHVDQILQDVALSEKRNTLSKNLSGGMKRKLSVAMAFCGGSKMVFLDEPTSGMDPFSRRFTWNVIRQYRQDRCIILTTHFMDEADILGDRIAIMADGHLRCVGSSLFLKKHYGVGYKLTIEKKRQQIGHSELQAKGAQALGELVRPATVSSSTKTESASTNADDRAHGASDKIECTVRNLSPEYMVDEDSKSHLQKLNSENTAEPSKFENSIGVEQPLIITTSGMDKELVNIVTSAVDEASLLHNVGSEMTLQLPIGTSSKFGSMFEGLDKAMESGLINSYGVSITTLDEVFLLVARGSTGDRTAFASSRNADSDHTLINEDKSSRSRMDLDQDGLFVRHVGALFMKRVAFFRRDRKAWLCTTILPSFFVLIGFFIFKFAAPQRNLDPITLDLSNYNTGIRMKPRNPIAFNDPSKPYSCQPGICSYQEPWVVESSTNEMYLFCGFLAKVNGTMNCSISESANIVSRITEAGASSQPTVVGNPYESSVSLQATSSAYAATQYGAIFFSHDPASRTQNGTRYNQTVFDICAERVPYANYATIDDCRKFGGIGYVIQYNFTALHVSPLYQSLADEAIIREALDTPNFEIKTTIAPLPITTPEDEYGKSEDAITAWFLIVLSFPFISGQFASFVVQERQSKAKHLQTVAGVKPVAYWLATFFWDVLNYQAPLWIAIALIFIFDVEVLSTTNRNVLSGVIVTLLLYGPASAGFTYCVSFAFTSPSMCNMFVILFSFLIGMGGPLTCFILTILGNQPGKLRPNLVDTAKLITWCLRFTPSFCLGKGLFNAINIMVFTFFAGDPNLTAWSEPILLYEVIFLAWQSFAFLALAIQLDRWSSNPRAMAIWRNVVRIVTLEWIMGSQAEREGDITTALPDDDDVLAEQDRVLSGEANSDLIVISQMTKVYDTGKVAVNNLSLGIPPGECFGLLGINGAGKTTTMSMLTAEFPPSQGDATLAGFSVVKEPEKTRRRIGYCPQFDAHFTNLTGREHVELYASIKGIPKQFVKEAAAAKLAEVGLSASDSDRLSAEYSGGMKRRLSLACAMIGEPRIVFLDECTTGVDPVARREIWQLISDMVTGSDIPIDQRTSVVLTTHSMEECEALCPRLGIMANGRLRCLGSAQHLKNKFGQGYQIELKVHLIDQSDADYQSNLVGLARFKMEDQLNAEENPSNRFFEISFALEDAISALKTLSSDDYLSDLVKAENPIGYGIWKDATSVAGVPLDTLAAFATVEMRIRNIGNFINEHYPKNVFRERQDLKTRYEVSSEGVQISSIFASIETHKAQLYLADYGVSQTSLEQVFNMHAAEAERLKQGHDDR